MEKLTETQKKLLFEIILQLTSLSEESLQGLQNSVDGGDLDDTYCVLNNAGHDLDNIIESLMPLLD